MKYIFKLYITDRTPSSVQAVNNLQEICKEIEGEYDISIINVLEQPDLAEQDYILATPTLVKELPLPSSRVIGDLSEVDKVLISLDIVTYQQAIMPKEDK